MSVEDGEQTLFITYCDILTPIARLGMFAYNEGVYRDSTHLFQLKGVIREKLFLLKYDRSLGVAYCTLNVKMFFYLHCRHKQIKENRLINDGI